MRLASPKHARAILFTAAVGMALMTAPRVSVVAQTAAADADVYAVTIAVDPRKANGQPWDGDGSAPEVRLQVITPGGGQVAPGGCSSHQCRFARTYIPRGATLHVYDDDVFAPDTIGQGPCELHQRRAVSCRLGQAQLTIEPLAMAVERAEAEAARGRAPRQLAVEEVRGLLVGQTISSADGRAWSFEAAEPFEARIVSQRLSADSSVVVVNVETNSTDGRQPASGRLEITLAWNNGTPSAMDVRAINFRMQAQ